MKVVSQVNAAPKALKPLEFWRLLREVHKRRKERDIAIIEILANTGLRVGELARSTLDDVEISPHKGEAVPPADETGALATHASAHL